MRVRRWLFARDRVVAPGWVLALAIVSLALPSTLTYFDGLPLSSVVEAAAFAVLIPLVVSSPLRRLLGRGLGKAPRSVRVALPTTLIVGLALKAVLFSASPAAFAACYRSTLTPPPAGECELSFQNPFRRFNATRLDAALSFTPDTWDLSFFNSLRFNLYPWTPGLRRRDRLPFSVTWRGVADIRWTEMLVSYSGEGTIAIGPRVIVLPPSYDEVSNLRIRLRPGRYPLRVHYTFDDGSLTNDERTPGPYATFSLRSVTDGGVEVEPVRPASPDRWLGASAQLVNALGVALAVSLLAWYGWLLRRRPSQLIVLVAAFAAAASMPLGGISPHIIPTVVACLLLGMLFIRNATSRLLSAYIALAALGVSVAVAEYPRLGIVVYRDAGQDWLTYESMARTVLETWSLEGAERVFYIQPLFRYVRFAERLLLGDGDLLPFLLAWTALHWNVLWAASVLLVSGRLNRFRSALFLAAGALTLALAGSPGVTLMMRLSLSEHATWIFTTAGVALLASRRPIRWGTGAAGIGAALITRPNQAPGQLMLAAALLLPALRVSRARALLAATVLVAVCLLPLAHNLYYGGQPVLFTTTSSHPATQGLPLRTIAAAPFDAAARGELTAQLRGLMFLRPWIQDPIGGEGVRFVMNGLLLVWFAALCLILRRSMPLHLRLLAVVPAAFLAVHVVFDVKVYYPRHILAAYFAMGLVTMAIAAAWRATPRTKQRLLELESSAARQ